MPGSSLRSAFLALQARDLVALLVAFAVCFGAAQLGSRFTRPELPGWYAALKKPSFTPPSWVFPVAWSTLFALMAIALWLAWRSADRQAGSLGGGLARAALPLAIFAFQLVLNVCWSLLFFRLHRPGAAFFLLGALWIAILATVLAFWRVRPLAGALLLPYLAWVLFAGVLNLSIWRSNLP